DLEGKTVGFTSDPQPKGALSTTAASLKMMVQKAGGDFSKIELLNVGDAGVQALATQKVHALGGVYEYHEKALLDKEGIKTDVYRLHEHGAPDFYELVFVTSQKVAAEQADLLRKFVKATERGVAYSKEKPDEVVDILVKAVPTLKKDLVKTQLTVVLPLYHDAGQPFGVQTRERWEAASRWMLENQLIAAAPDLDKLLAK
ncbi:MAG TPA: ABC transporter substrate-binding protein, partial [Symbiobacteriaceae bacterium]|nr:ABC transporter substrate-binding protein [Symbiobacteriaceae bacterium]